MAVPKLQEGVEELTMTLAGRTREQLDTLLAHKSRSELIDLIHSLVTVEILLKPADIAARSCLNKRAVLRDIRDGKFGDYYCRAENSIAVPASGVNQWRRSFLVPATTEALMTASNCSKIPIERYRTKKDAPISIDALSSRLRITSTLTIGSVGGKNQPIAAV